jgi:SPP1 family predicted phage head-tail adaptor
MPMRSGSLRHSVTIEARHDAKDTFGGLSPQWRPVATNVPASIEPLKGKELFNAQQVQSEVLLRIRIRYRPGIVPAMRVKYRGRVYGILYVIDINLKNEELHLMCNQGLNEG